VWAGVKDEEAAAGVGLVGFIISKTTLGKVHRRRALKRMRLREGGIPVRIWKAGRSVGSGVSFRREIYLLLYLSNTASNIESPDPKAAAVPYIVAVQAADNTERAGMREH